MTKVSEFRDWLDGVSDDEFIAIGEGGLDVVILPAGFVMAASVLAAQRLSSDATIESFEIGGIPVAETD